jgi:hypothetical protein
MGLKPVPTGFSPMQPVRGTGDLSRQTIQHLGKPRVYFRSGQTASSRYPNSVPHRKSSRYVDYMEGTEREGSSIGPYRANIGMEYRTIRATIPLIELTATPERLEFRARFGLGLFLGPWRFEREQVTKIFAGPGWFSDCVHIQGERPDMRVFTYGPGPLMLTLEELGYPVDWLSRR